MTKAMTTSHLGLLTLELSYANWNLPYQNPLQAKDMIQNTMLQIKRKTSCISQCATSPNNKRNQTQI